jgi:hypothetical protein
MDLDTSGYSPSSKGYVDTSFLRANKRGVYESDDELSVDDEEGEEEEEGNSSGVRRSRRKTKGKRLEYWKNERSVYMKGKMMGLLVANPTPVKPKRKHTTGGGTKKMATTTDKKRSRKEILVKKLESDSSDGDAELPPPDIPRQYKYLKR